MGARAMDRMNKGQEILDRAFGGKLGNSGPAFDEFNELTQGHLFGEVWSREGLALRDRSLITVAVLCADGKERQLAGHLKGALNLGLKPDMLKEVMIHVAHYAGWPCGMNGLRVLTEVVESAGMTFDNANS